MKFVDKNETLNAPEGYDVVSVLVEGAFLRIVYHLHEYQPEMYPSVIVYLNDAGREVGRCMIEAEPNIKPKILAPVGRRFRFRNGFLITLQGIGEMIKCLKR